MTKQRKQLLKTLLIEHKHDRKFRLNQSPSLDVVLQEILQRTTGINEYDLDRKILKKYKSKMISALGNFLAQEDYINIRKIGQFFQAIIFDEEEDENARQFWMENQKCKIFVDLVQKYLDQINDMLQT